ncbi:MAG: hypothetical protein IPJ90_06230 [Anaerolineaceae bacterium]|nr:hypothetical protein [Anaerolineaceae bacterium]
MSEIIIPTNSNIYTTFQQLATGQRLVFLAGLPGTGKSLLIQQLVLLAQQAGRTVDLLQWDLARAPFETAVLLQKYPEIDGATHPTIRKAVGLWARTAVHQWHALHQNSNRLLIGETPLIGNRLIELVQATNDAIEADLSSSQTRFVVPVPSTDVRRHIEAAREKSIANPQHQNESDDAPPNVLHAIWQEVARLGQQLQLAQQAAPAEKPGHFVYDPAVYTAVYQHLLQHRHHQMLPINTLLKPSGSVYDLPLSGTKLTATPAEVDAIMQQIETKFTGDALETAVANWYQL